jgi:serine/threonine-protein kinase
MNETPFGPQGTLIGKTLGDYELVELLTSGGMARIYKGLDVRLQRFAAVKVLMRELLDSDETLPERFQREARAVAQLDHPNIVNIYQTGEQDGYMFIAMRLIEGSDLADEITRLRRLGQMMDPRRAVAILEQVAEALDYAHARGIIHRDFKPSNVLLDAQDRAYLTDFGLALWQSKDKTMGTAFGTPRYIAPEQALASETAVPQSDIYAMAVVLYEILTGDMLFRADTPMQIALSHISEPPPSPRLINPSIPEGVEQELLRALAKDAKQRPQTAGEFISGIKAAYAAADATVTQQTSPAAARPTPRPLTETPPTVVIPEPRTPVSQQPKPKPLPASPVPSRARWPLIVVATGILLTTLVLGAGVIYGGINDRANAAATATREQAMLIADLSATATATATDAVSATPSGTATATDTATATFTSTPENVMTQTSRAETAAARQRRATERALAFVLTSDAALASPVTPSATPTATDTAEPTETDTPEPTETDTEVPTDTPTGTDTLEPTSTDTSAPTDTAGPNTRVPTSTNTRRPSPSPVPTETTTPRPTHTPAATDTPEGVLATTTARPTVEPVRLSIRYTIDFFVVRTESTTDADVSELVFSADGFPDQRLGGSSPVETLESGQCSVIQQERRTFDAEDYGCPTPIERLTSIPATAVFWRGAATGSFNVEYDGRVIKECPLATRTQAQECEVVFR